jgi:hypothetical protein
MPLFAFSRFASRTLRLVSGSRSFWNRFREAPFRANLSQFHKIEFGFVFIDNFNMPVFEIGFTEDFGGSGMKTDGNARVFKTID